MTVSRGALIAVLSLVMASPSRACEGRLFDGSNVLGAPLCLSAAPKRIVSLDPTFSLGMALELGAPVVAAPMSGMSDKALKRRAEEAGVVDLETFGQPSVERVVALKPDLIIGSGFLGAMACDMAARIAPMALITADDWKAFYLTLVKFAGREEAAKGVFYAYQRRIADIRAGSLSGSRAGLNPDGSPSKRARRSFRSRSCPRPAGLLPADPLSQLRPDRAALGKAQGLQARRLRCEKTERPAGSGPRSLFAPLSARLLVLLREPDGLFEARAGRSLDAREFEFRRNPPDDVAAPTGLADLARQARELA